MRVLLRSSSVNPSSLTGVHPRRSHRIYNQERASYRPGGCQHSAVIGGDRACPARSALIELADPEAARPLRPPSRELTIPKGHQ